MSDWSIDERRAYAIGIEKGRDLARKEQQSEQALTLRDRFAMAVLAGGSGMRPKDEAKRAYAIADEMLAQRNPLDDEIPF